jgi:hypothetical protein
MIGQILMIKRAVFFRIGWMKYYDGPKQDDLKPIHGGSYNKKKVGKELYNFSRIRGQCFGFCQPVANSTQVTLEKIKPDWGEDSLEGVTVVFVAVNEEVDPHRQCVVGWYRNATVYRCRQEVRSPKGERRKYSAVARVADAVLLHPDARDWWVKAGTGGIGEANVCYLYHDDGRPKRQSWQIKILKNIEEYRPPRKGEWSSQVEM